MSDTPKSPRRKRQIAVALVLLALAGGLWWAMQPKFDPKLIGTWIREEGSNGFFGLRFNADGTQEECELLTESRPIWTSVWNWSLSGNHFRQRPNPANTTPWTRLKWLAMDRWDRLRGAPWHYEIIELNDNTLKLRPLNPAWSNYGRIESYNRIPDNAVTIWKTRFSFPMDESSTIDPASLLPVESPP